MEDSKDEYKKVSFDARLHYYPLLMKLEQEYIDNMLIGNYQGAYTALRKTFTNTRPWIRKEHIVELNTLFVDVEKKLAACVNKQYQSFLSTKIRSILTIIDDKIHEYAKDMYLPQGGSDDDGVDWDDIIKRGKT